MPIIHIIHDLPRFFSWCVSPRRTWERVFKWWEMSTIFINFRSVRCQMRCYVGRCWKAFGSTLVYHNLYILYICIKIYKDIYVHILSCLVCMQWQWRLTGRCAHTPSTTCSWASGLLSAMWSCEAQRQLQTQIAESNAGNIAVVVVWESMKERCFMLFWRDISRILNSV